jgi:hypothetical protein
MILLAFEEIVVCVSFPIWQGEAADTAPASSPVVGVLNRFGLEVPQGLETV